ncbi:hypothetical protein SELMODRAFT_232013 [Selaginella moellendorffii]|uniref:Uncharacterized protein n=1 Tax=Selaginella moellendorffii TaxID=88036 RepID=D8RPE8_SELML|nr:GDSL esterase/lipase At2g23540 [Selaginella moellendorffii]EFJ26026.1 hypothetical protein SELMODRAFT_232013 [Selaginella moellendorffii]|eukprot:XP_002972805.1 GDSL esterase/lipase At2g23540 [Selaginella moellendorffii]
MGRFPLRGALVLGLWLLFLSITAQCQAPASFVFGDSLVDGGNNNYIFSLSKADQPANGVDFPGGRPTGRFCNGRTIPDIIGESFGIPYAPPYLAPTTHGAAILRGVNYASGGGGIVDETGRIFIGRLSLSKQLLYFQNTTRELKSMLGEDAARQYLAKSIFSVTIGANDYLNNYLLPVPLTGDSFLTPRAFQDKLITNFRQQLTTLYNSGARKIIVAGVGPIGCIPYQLTLNLRRDGSCVSSANKLALNYNTALRDLILELNSKLPGSMFSYANAYDVVWDIITNKKNYGFETSDLACCGIGGPYKGVLPCGPNVPVCNERSKFFFWDPYHPSDAANAIVAKRFVDGDERDIFPRNVRQLIEM